MTVPVENFRAALLVFGLATRMATAVVMMVMRRAMLFSLHVDVFSVLETGFR